MDAVVVHERKSVDRGILCNGAGFISSDGTVRDRDGSHQAKDEGKEFHDR